MGGCRCTFRSCERRSNTHPETHYFHYPYRQRQRCEEWARNAGRLYYMQLPDSQLRNKVVCQLHFRPACFMNYLQKSLIKTAVPTLQPVERSDDVLDWAQVEEGGQPVRERPDGRRMTAAEAQAELAEMDGYVVEMLAEADEAESVAAGAAEAGTAAEEQELTELINEGEFLYDIDIANEPAETEPEVVDNPVDTSADADVGELLQVARQQPAAPEEAGETPPVVRPPPKILNGANLPQLQRLSSLKRVAVVKWKPVNATETDGWSKAKRMRSEDSDKDVEEEASNGASPTPATPTATVDPNSAAATIAQLRTALAARDTDLTLLAVQHSATQSAAAEAAQIRERRLQAQLVAAAERSQQLAQEATDRETGLRSTNHFLQLQITSQDERNAREMAKNVAQAAQLSAQQESSRQLQQQLDQLQQQRDELQAQNDRLKEQLAEQGAEVRQLQVALKRAAVTASVAAAPAPAAVAASPSPAAALKPGQLSKQQLLGGIRRYLNPTMIALLRMELFSDGEREYKPDERLAAMELWSLPAKGSADEGRVYEFMLSEWRFRLPPKSAVLQWIRERDEAAEEECYEDDCC